MKSIILSLLLLPGLVFAQGPSKPPTPAKPAKTAQAPTPLPPTPLSAEDQNLILQANINILNSLSTLKDTEEYQGYHVGIKNLQALMDNLKKKDGCKDITTKMECVK